MLGRSTRDEGENGKNYRMKKVGKSKLTCSEN